MKKNKTFIITYILTPIALIIFPIITQAKSDLIGLWVNVKKEPVIEFIQGFKPNRGTSIVYKKGKISNVQKWELEGDKIKIGYSSIKVKGKNIIYGSDTLSKSDKSRKITKTIDLKKDTNKFIDDLTSYYWKTGDEKKLYYFMKGFSNETGIYNSIKLPKKESDGLGNWSIAKDVFNLGNTLYLSGRITDTYMIFLDKRDNILLFLRSEKTKELERKDLKTLKEKFVVDLTSGDWLQKSYGGYTTYKYRPFFGDLSGVILSFGSDGIFKNSSEWEYSIKTGSIKQGYTEYTNAQIQGDYLLLLNKDGKVSSYQRSPGKITANRFTDVKKVNVSEKDTTQLTKLLDNQWHKGSETFQFVFKNKNEGYLHRFITYPILISGNKLEVKGWSKVEDVKFHGDVLLFGKNNQALALDTKQVYLKHISDEESKIMQSEKKSKAKEISKKSIALSLTTLDGKEIRIPLPVESLQQIVRFSIEPN